MTANSSGSLPALQRHVTLLNISAMHLAYDMAVPTPTLSFVPDERCWPSAILFACTLGSCLDMFSVPVKHDTRHSAGQSVCAAKMLQLGQVICL